MNDIDAILTKQEQQKFLAYLQLATQFLEQEEQHMSKVKDILSSLLNFKKAEHKPEQLSNNIESTPAREKIVYKDKIIEKRVEVPVEVIKEIEKRIEVTPAWAKSLEKEFDFMQLVQQENQLSKILLPQGTSDVLRLIALASQWSNLLRVWDAIAEQVKQNKQAASTAQLEILEHCLSLFNLTLTNNQATLNAPSLGASYDYEIHQKVAGSGGIINEILLAGIKNAAGETIKMPIVITH